MTPCRIMRNRHLLCAVVDGHGDSIDAAALPSHLQPTKEGTRGDSSDEGESVNEDDDGDDEEGGKGEGDEALCNMDAVESIVQGTVLSTLDDI